MCLDCLIRADCLICASQAAGTIVEVDEIYTPLSVLDTPPCDVMTDVLTC